MVSERIKIKKNVDLDLLTTLGIGGKANYFFLVGTVSDLSKLLKETGPRPYILGNGSNLLIKDGLIKKPVIKLVGKFGQVRKKGNVLEVGSSILLSFLIKYSLKEGLGGLENLAGIPASIGGMLVCGASSFQANIFDYLKEVEVMDFKGKLYKIKKDEINYGYRYSSLSGRIVVGASFSFPGNKSKSKEKIKNIIQKRIALQDFSLPSCGSVFKNPSQAAAGNLIEQVGLKGKRRGGLKISDKHANFIVNLGKGSFQDADYLIQNTKDIVYRKKGIVLEEEIQRWS
ncbi:MAG: UDP-N-acetylmuramate dehydrogenase [Candidatus Omnitrophica bacterium]|nr:UDP-N-acetylmuramate dehydrogenase [Candidatus Omnitrophota bacterium]MCF7877031.1 UDP-N-acetylmuramate dehydrogenase [Candidatus Omnitrophota bacterium]MCF7892541.1 UDP-N-acetylmuramate dehydrogenase [Candidatus Omnitrophota bacterium]